MSALVTSLFTATAAQLAADAPSLSVRETCYGTATREGHRESIQGIEIRIISRNDPGTSCQVQCFFIKKGKSGSPFTIDDAVLFDVTDPHGTYRVTARPIALGKAPSSRGTGSSKKKSPSKSSSPSKPADFSADHPREGFLVRILHEGTVLREHGSSHSIEQLAHEDPELFAKASESKKARRLEAATLLVH